MATDAEVKEKELSNEELTLLLEGTPGVTGANVLTAKDGAKTNLFTNPSKIDDKKIDDILKDVKEGNENNENLSEEDKKKKEEADRLKKEAELKAQKEKEEGERILRESLESEEGGGGAGGEKKPALNKEAMIKVVDELIEKKILVPFEGDKPIKDYTIKELTSLIEENLKNKDEEAWKQIPGKFIESLSPELQYVAQYELNGGKDSKKVFRMLAEAAEVKNLDIKTEQGQEEVIRMHLEMTGFGTPEEIKEEITSIKDRNELEKKATQFKPKVDARKEEEVKETLKKQEALKKRHEASAKKFESDVFKVLEPGELNGIKLDQKTQETLFYGLTNSNYPSITGKSTNMLGHLLEKKQFIEPDLPLISEVLWLLNDPKGYKEQIRTAAGKEANAETILKLKKAEAEKNNGGTGLQNEGGEEKTSGKLKKPGNIFKRD